MEQDFTPMDPNRFEEALRRIDEANAADPNLESDGIKERPRELLYADRLSAWVLKLRPDASEALRLAARCQHIRRWEVPRSSFPMTRAGYLKWRESLKHRHAEMSGSILREVGYPEAIIHRVQSLNRKERIKEDPECQTLEDGLCLVFLEFQLDELANRTSEDKILTAIQKSWVKMSPQAHTAALGLELSSHAQGLVKKALDSSPTEKNE